MDAKVETPENTRQDNLKWLVGLILLAAGIIGFYYFSEYMLLLRVVALLALAGAAVWILSQTQKGRYAREFLRGAHSEVRKVVWPSRRETLQVTGIVILMVIIVALMIWLVDSILFWIVRSLTS